MCAGVTEELLSSHGLWSMTFGGGGGGLVLGVPSFSSSPTTIMTGWSSRGCISCWVQRASVPRSWPVFVPSAPLHSQALCSSVRPGWVIKKARAQVVIIRGLSSKKAPTRKVMYAPSAPPIRPPTHSLNVALNIAQHPQRLGNAR